MQAMRRRVAVTGRTSHTIEARERRNHSEHAETGSSSVVPRRPLSDRMRAPRYAAPHAAALAQGSVVVDILLDVVV